MKIDEVRPSFTVYFIGSEIESLGGVTEALRLAGYMVLTFPQMTSALSELQSNPPHFVILSYTEKAFTLSSAIQQITLQLPETHILVVTPVADRAKATALLQAGVYDLIFTPLVSETELVRRLDRATERDYFMYLNEQLMQQQSDKVTDAPLLEGSLSHAVGSNGSAASEDFHLSRLYRLFNTTTADDCIQSFLESMSQFVGSFPVVFFKYVQNRRLLMATQSYSAKDFNLENLGINFNDLDNGFRTGQLRDPMQVAEFVAMVQEVFETQDFFAFPVEALGEIQGVVCFLRPLPNAGTMETLHGWLAMLGKALSLIEAEKRLHVVTTKDMGTDVLNRQNFMSKVNEEISRARRTKLPVSLVQIAIDKFGRLTSTYDSEECQVVMRTAAQILVKHSRINDIVGRLGPDEFGLLLPHTRKQGAMIKGERLRRIFESADFDKILRGVGRLTVSIGVSEYPALARDAEELVQAADDALFQVRSVGNKTCVAKVSEGFEPDFIVNEKGS